MKTVKKPNKHWTAEQWDEWGLEVNKRFEKLNEYLNTPEGLKLASKDALRWRFFYFVKRNTFLYHHPYMCSFIRRLRKWCVRLYNSPRIITRLGRKSGCFLQRYLYSR